jgi:hypothetical protein
MTAPVPDPTRLSGPLRGFSPPVGLHSGAHGRAAGAEGRRREAILVLGESRRIS